MADAFDRLQCARHAICKVRDLQKNGRSDRKSSDCWKELAPGRGWFRDVPDERDPTIERKMLLKACSGYSLEATANKPEQVISISVDLDRSVDTSVCRLVQQSCHPLRALNRQERIEISVAPRDSRLRNLSPSRVTLHAGVQGKILLGLASLSLRALPSSILERGKMRLEDTLMMPWPTHSMTPPIAVSQHPSSTVGKSAVSCI
jgi:hypothetical protein